MKIKQRFIEKLFPIKELSNIAPSEKKAKIGHISSLHLWWSRKPLSVSRAVIYTSLIDLPENMDEKENMIQFIADLSKLENSFNNQMIQKARADILKANNDKVVKILDPFAGGGSIPLEALRLGAETYAMDYNPVSVFILNTTLKYPLKYPYIVDDVKKWSEWVAKEVENEVKQFYPSDPDGSIPIYYIWATQIQCQNQSCNIKYPLLYKFSLVDKKEKLISLYPYTNGQELKFKIVGTDHENIPEGFNPLVGTIKKGVAICPVCGSIIDNQSLRTVFKTGKVEDRLMFIVLQDLEGKKKYRLPTEKDIENFKKAEEYLEIKRQKLMNEWGLDPIPNEIIPEASNTASLYAYGLIRWGDLFNARQKLLLITTIEKIRLAYKEMIKEGYDREYAKAITSYLAIIIGKIADYNSRLTVWFSTEERVKQIFYKQALSLSWGYGEEHFDIIRKKVTIIEKALSNLVKTPPTIIDKDSSKKIIPIIQRGSATDLPYPDDYFDAVITDPPYYDYISYASISDIFYILLKRCIDDLYPELFQYNSIPKLEEIVLEVSRHNNKEEAIQFYIESLTKAFQEIYRVLKPDGIAVIMYAHKDLNAWEPFFIALMQSGFKITTSISVPTEDKTRFLAIKGKTISNSVLIICRKIQKKDIGIIDNLLEEIKEHFARKLDMLKNEGIEDVDLPMIGLSASFEIISSYDKIVSINGDEVDLKTIFKLIKKVLLDELKAIDNTNDVEESVDSSPVIEIESVIN